MTGQVDENAEPDERVVARVRAGDPGAFRLLVERHEAAVFGLLRAILSHGADPEDVAQEAFLAAWRRLDTFDAARGSFRGWLLAIARNRGFTALRREGPRRLAALAEPAPPETDPAALSPDPEAFRRLDLALASLAPERRVAFVLAEIHGVPLAEVARIEDVPVGTIKSRLARAREDLRAAASTLATPPTRREPLP